MKSKFLGSVLLRAFFIFVAVNLLIGNLNWRPFLGQISGYNWLFPGRKRLPFGEIPSKSYNLNSFNLDILFSTMEINRGIKPENEYRVILIGDSSVWGTLQHPEETIAARIQESNQIHIEGKKIRVYNLGYPTDSTFKDLLILDYSRRYQPDMIIWMVTLDSLAQPNQLNSPIVMQNQDWAQTTIQKNKLNIPENTLTTHNDIWSNSLIARRKELAEWYQIQFYGFMWAATGIDQYYPPVYSLAQRDLSGDDSYPALMSPLKKENLALDVLQLGMTLAGETPILIVNEPILISSGSNSDIRYNFNYPHWAYDQYRVLLSSAAAENGWQYLDLWNSVSENEFTNTAFHISPIGVSSIIAPLSNAMQKVAQNTPLPRTEVVIMHTKSVPPKIPVKIETAFPIPNRPQIFSPPSKQFTTPLTGTCSGEENWQNMPVLPDYVSEEMHSLYESGLANGNQPNVLSIIGDCQNVPSVFLGAFENNSEYSLGQFTYLKPVIDQFIGSFGRKGITRHGGLNIAGVQNPAQADKTVCKNRETPLACELRLNHPSIVIISLEEWWAGRPVDIYQTYLRQVLDTVISSGAVPILSTKADNIEGNQAINKIVVKTACEYHVPVWNFWAAAQKLPGRGLWTDRFHLTVGTFDFSDPTQLKTGRSMRNLTALQSLDFIWRALNYMHQN